MFNKEQKGDDAIEELELLHIPKGKATIPSEAREDIKKAPRVTEETIELKPQNSAAYDGVFSNLPARPELMQLPKNQDESPPPYTTSGDAHGIFANYMGHSDVVGYDDLIFEDLEVGSFGVFFLYLIVTIFFEWFGFILCILLSQSHAAKYGSIAGLGITVSLNSVAFSDLVVTSKYWSQHSDIAALLSFLIAFSGYALILFGFFSYMRVRKLSVNPMLSVQPPTGA